MQRPLVIADESARHWFRARLAPDREVIVEKEPGSDLRLFLLTFGAAFLAFSGFIA